MPVGVQGDGPAAQAQVDDDGDRRGGASPPQPFGDAGGGQAATRDDDVPGSGQSHSRGSAERPATEPTNSVISAPSGMR